MRKILTIVGVISILTLIIAVFAGIAVAIIEKSVHALIIALLALILLKMEVNERKENIRTEILGRALIAVMQKLDENDKE